MESQLRLTVVLGFWNSLYILPEVIVPISGVHLCETFRYFYCKSGEGLNSLESQLRLTVLLGFLHSLYILPYVIVTISGVHLTDTLRYSTVSQERV